MTDTKEDIEQTAAWLRAIGKSTEGVGYPASSQDLNAAADMLLTLQAHAEAAEKERDEAREHKVLQQARAEDAWRKCDAIYVKLTKVQARANAAEYEAKRYCQDVARWHERAEIMEAALTKIASCEKHVDGDVVDIARKALLEAKP